MKIMNMEKLNYIITLICKILMTFTKIVKVNGKITSYHFNNVIKILMKVKSGIQIHLDYIVQFLMNRILYMVTIILAKHHGTD